jgi:hypothetical protein
MKHLKALLVLALGLAVTIPAFAETQNVKVSGSMDAYWFYRRNFDLRDSNDAGSIPAGTAVPAGGGAAGSISQRSEDDDYFMSITQAEISADLTDNVSTVINLINQRDWNADTFSGGAGGGAALGTEEFDLLLDLAYVEMKEIFYAPLTLKVGRQDLLFGRGFIVGWNPQDPQANIQADEFTQIQSFDAIRATLDFNPWTIDLVYSNINENSHNAEDDRDLWIANLNYKFAEYNAVAELYAVSETDRATLAAAAGTANNDTHTVGGRVQFDPISQMTLGAELAYQFGNYRAAIASPERDRDAWGSDLFAEYRFDNAWKPMLGLEYVYLSGENDLGAGTTQSYGAWNGAFRGPVYGWYHDYKEVYYATSAPNDQAAGQNQEHISIYGTIKPMEDLMLSANYFHFWTAETAHTVTADPNSGSLSDHIGDEIDLLATYNYTEDVTFSLMADWFIPGDLYSKPNDATATQVISRVLVSF